MTTHERNATRGIAMTLRTLPVLIAALLLTGPALRAQEDVPSKVDLRWNRYYDHDEILDVQRRIQAAYPDIVENVTIGQTLQGRDMIVTIVTNPAAGAHDQKPAMWIDGNIHGNEIQASEMVLYTMWYLTKMHGVNDDITQILDDYAFYLLPSVNPDGRQYWFDAPNNSSSSRSNQRPEDSDRDGLVDEDPPEDLDGDGSITSMWKQDPLGDYVRDRKDPRVFRRFGEDEEPPADERWVNLGREGIDNDGDGRVNEDGPGGDDMNRNWPSDWQPTYVQGGAGPYPFHHPETHNIGAFILAHPNIAGVQSYHNSGGMILRGSGTQYRDSMFQGSDVRVYEKLGRTGEDLLPWYRLMVIWKDLYNVHGGSIDWTAEGLGIFSFSNELWAQGKYFQRDSTYTPREDQMDLFRDRLQFGQTFKDYTEYDHPQHGKVLVGGLNKWASRTTPTFMLEEECHRNAAFTIFHADQMPKVSFEEVAVARAGALWRVDVELKNEKIIPTRSGIAQRRRIGRNDLLLVENVSGDAEVVAAGSIRSRRDDGMSPVLHEPARLQLPEGVPSEGSVLRRFYVAGEEGAVLRLRFVAEKARDVETTFTLE